jgi:cellulose synthase/poly-beta-1,6-N-acetylglucosamine synthase-like glycosyltransferase
VLRNLTDDPSRLTGGSHGRRRIAVLIACKNGEATIGNAVRSAADQADVYVVSDGSTDGRRGRRPRRSRRLICYG